MSTKIPPVSRRRDFLKIELAYLGTTKRADDGSKIFYTLQRIIFSSGPFPSLSGVHPLEANDSAPVQREQEDRPPETLEEKVPDYMDNEATAYLAYLLKEAEMIRLRTEMIRRNTSIIIALLAVAIIVLVIIWLDITGVIPIF
jgi:hypothetical protein